MAHTTFDIWLLKLLFLQETLTHVHRVVSAKQMNFLSPSSQIIHVNWESGTQPEESGNRKLDALKSLNSLTTGTLIMRPKPLASLLTLTVHHINDLCVEYNYSCTHVSPGSMHAKCSKRSDQLDFQAFQVTHCKVVQHIWTNKGA